MVYPVPKTNNTLDSVGRLRLTEPFNLQVSRGQIYGHTPFLLYGYSSNVSNTAFGPLWEGLTQSGGLYTFPSTAVQMTVSSTSVTDTAPRAVVIMGLDANYIPISETLPLNGTTPVTTVNSYLRINNVTMANSTNTGNIVVSNGGTTYAQINAGLGQTQASIYTVPAGYTLYILRSYKTANIGFTSSAWINFQVQFNNNVTGQVLIVNEQTFVQQIEVNYETLPRKVTEKTDIQYLFKASTSGPLICSANITGILIKNNADAGNTFPGYF